MISQHTAATGSARGKAILAEFSRYLPFFKKILPYDYDRMPRCAALCCNKISIMVESVTIQSKVSP